MADPDTSPAALRALAEYWADDKPAGVHGDDPDAIDAILRETDAKMAETIAALRALAAEKEAGAPAPAQGPLTEVGETSRGYKLYRAPNPVGGSTYWSDEIGGGVVVWDTCLVGEETLRLALAIETGKEG